MAKITHITTRRAGLHADTSIELARAIAVLTAAGYTVSDIEDNPAEPWHVAIIHYTRLQELRTLQALVKQ
jgi:hypothetical protein